MKMPVSESERKLYFSFISFLFFPIGNENLGQRRDLFEEILISTFFFIVFVSAGEQDLFCSNIDYFPNEEYSPDPNDSTMAIPCKYETFLLSYYTNLRNRE